MYQMAAQGCEGQIGACKRHSSSNGTGRSDMPKKVMQHSDTSGTGMVANNQIDVKRLLAMNDYDPLRIFNRDVTPVIENQIEQGLPPLAVHIIGLLKSLDVNRRMSPLLAVLNDGLPDFSIVAENLANEQVNSRHDIPAELNEFHDSRDEIENHVLKNRQRLNEYV